MEVALFTRAWIEILHGFYEQEAASVALFTRAWIEMVCLLSLTVFPTCRPLYEGVD